MISFFVCLAILILGYFIYGGYVESCFRPPIDDRKTPAYRLEDGVDYVPMGTGRVFLIQLLNIAGLGPIFGALAGAMWGPAVFLWITFGTVCQAVSTTLFLGCCLKEMMVPPFPKS